MREQHFHIFCRCPQCGNFGVFDFYGIRIFHHLIFRIRRQNAIRRNGQALIVQAVDVNVVDNASPIHKSCGGAQGKIIVYRQVDDGIAVVIQTFRARSRGNTGVQCHFHSICAGRAGDITHGTAERTRAVQSALRATQHFDTFQVFQNKVGVNRGSVYVSRNSRRGGECVVTQCGAIDIKTANHDTINHTGIAATPIHYRHTRNIAHQFGLIRNLCSGDRITGNGGNVVRNILYRGRASGCRHDNFFDRPLALRLREHGMRSAE